MAASHIEVRGIPAPGPTRPNSCLRRLSIQVVRKAQGTSTCSCARRVSREATRAHRKRGNARTVRFSNASTVA